MKSEEIPVAFSSFMALGAARLSRMGVLTRQPQTVESLGSATVICTDKTGTITQEGMSMRQLYDSATDTLVELPDVARPDVARLETLSDTAKSVLAYASWSSETDPFDPMETAIVVAFVEVDPATAASPYPMVHEYPLAGTPPMMTHVSQSPSGALIVAGKGAVEHILAVCHPEPAIMERIRTMTNSFPKTGFGYWGWRGGRTSHPTFRRRRMTFGRFWVLSRPKIPQTEYGGSHPVVYNGLI